MAQQFKPGELVKVHNHHKRGTIVDGFYGIICAEGVGATPALAGRDLTLKDYLVHLQNGDDCWCWNDELIKASK